MKSAEMAERIRPLLAQRLGLPEIGAALGVSRQRVHQVIRKSGLAPYRTRARLNSDTPALRLAHVCDCGNHGFVGLNNGLAALFSPEDMPLIAGSLWYCAGTGRHRYAARPAAQPRMMHRVILAADTPHIDHANSDGLDNRRCNLRPCSVSENHRNRRLSRRNTSGFKGVHYHAGKFVARIATRHIGRFATPEEAARAYDAAARQHFGEYARTNADLGLLPTLVAAQ